MSLAKVVHLLASEEVAGIVLFTHLVLMVHRCSNNSIYVVECFTFREVTNIHRPLPPRVDLEKWFSTLANTGAGLLFLNKSFLG